MKRDYCSLRDKTQKWRREASHRLHPVRRDEFKLMQCWLREHAGMVCDIGCGDGYWSSRFADRAHRVVGVDVDLTTLVRARKHYGEKARFVLATGEALPFRNEAFAAIVSISVWQFLEDERRGAVEARRVLQPSAPFCLSVDSLSLPSLPSDYIEWHRTRYGVHRLYTLDTLKALLEDAGFTVTEGRHLTVSAVSAWFIRMQTRQGWNVNYMAPISLPLTWLAESLSARECGGYYVIATAQKLEGR